MGNRFINIKAGDTTVKLSNAATDVLFDTLLLSASDLAVSDWQKIFASWIAGHDQSMIGSGTVGFDIDDIGWTQANFETELAFVLETIELAMQKHRWDALNYTPAHLFVEKLQSFRDLVASYQQSFIDQDNEWGVSLIEPDMEFQLCPKHKVYMHTEGCHICNNQAL